MNQRNQTILDKNGRLFKTTRDRYAPDLIVNNKKGGIGTDQHRNNNTRRRQLRNLKKILRVNTKYQMDRMIDPLIMKHPDIVELILSRHNSDMKSETANAPIDLNK